MTTDKPLVAFNLPYNQSKHYWLAIFLFAENAALKKELVTCGMQALSDPANGYIIHLTQPWCDAWWKIRALPALQQADAKMEFALIAGNETLPVADELAIARKPLHTMDTLAASLWLGDAMLHDQLVSYMQPVFDKRGKVFGYEAFARVETDKELIGGGRIIEASRGLNAEYMLDRHLHVKAITSFISSDLEGFLFINFVPGFIHRPEKYLEGLSDSAHQHGMPAKQIVLDLPHSETPHDTLHLKAISEYCRSKGYSLSLDDIASVAVANKILDAIRPDFIKLDVALVCRALNKVEFQVISDLVSLAHLSGVTVIAEGVETQEIHNELLRAGVDLFQGYLFSPPVAVSKLKKAMRA